MKHIGTVSHDTNAYVTFADETEDAATVTHIQNLISMTAAQGDTFIVLHNAKAYAATVTNGRKKNSRRNDLVQVMLLETSLAQENTSRPDIRGIIESLITGAAITVHPDEMSCTLHLLAAIAPHAIYFENKPYLLQRDAEKITNTADEPLSEASLRAFFALVNAIASGRNGLSQHQLHEALACACAVSKPMREILAEKNLTREKIAAWFSAFYGISKTDRVISNRLAILAVLFDAAEPDAVTITDGDGVDWFGFYQQQRLQPTFGISPAAICRLLGTHHSALLINRTAVYAMLRSLPVPQTIDEWDEVLCLRPLAFEPDASDFLCWLRENSTEDHLRRAFRMDALTPYLEELAFDSVGIRGASTAFLAAASFYFDIPLFCGGESITAKKLDQLAQNGKSDLLSEMLAALIFRDENRKDRCEDLRNSAVCKQALDQVAAMRRKEARAAIKSAWQDFRQALHTLNHPFD